MASFDEPNDAPASRLIGIESLDAEHRELDHLIDELAVFPQESILSLRARRLIRDLWRCSFDHFRDEERLMTACGIAPADLEHHVADHARCLNYVTGLWAARYENLGTAPGSGDVQRELAEYWRRHIAEYDLRMEWERTPPARRDYR